MTANGAPTGLSGGGMALWEAVAGEHELSVAQQVQLLEACRAKDRLDKLDALLCGDAEVWTRLAPRAGTDIAVLMVDRALDKANTTANTMKQLLAALRLPDEVSGKRPQFRGSRVQRPSGGKLAGVSSLDRARAAAAGA